MTLHRNGDLIGTADQLDSVRFAVPAGTATYRLTTEAEQDFTDLTTKTTTIWTFTALPLPTVRYEPPVDLRNQAPGGRAVVLPVHVAQGAAPRSLTVEVSYDGGIRWQPARVTGAGEHRTAHLRHQAGPGHRRTDRHQRIPAELTERRSSLWPFVRLLACLHVPTSANCSLWTIG